MRSTIIRVNVSMPSRDSDSIAMGSMMREVNVKVLGPVLCTTGCVLCSLSNLVHFEVL